MVIAAGDGGAPRNGRGGGVGPAAVDVAAAHVAVEVESLATEVKSDELLQQQNGGGSGCRICHLGDGDLPAERGSGQLMSLGCGCRGEIAAAHRRCAEAWFSVRGNRRCEICGKNATNITGWGGGGKEFMQEWHEMAGVDAGGSSKACSFFRSQSFCYLLLACLITVFFIPWLIHNHIV